MSDDWRFFMCSMGDHLASIMVDVGVSKTLDSLPPTLANLALHYKEPDDRGLPTRAEFDAVIAIEDQLEKFVKAAGDGYVGRVTSKGQRFFYIYTTRKHAEWETFTQGLAERSGYQIDLALTGDAAHEEYWEYLFPTPDDWQVISDMDVIAAMKKEGDDENAQHKIDHFAYFPDEASARQFIAWAEADRFKHVATESGPQEDGQYGVALYHLGVTEQREISSHTIALRQAAEKFGGEYDGWGTTVVQSSE